MRLAGKLSQKVENEDHTTPEAASSTEAATNHHYLKISPKFQTMMNHSAVKGHDKSYFSSIWIDTMYILSELYFIFSNEDLTKCLAYYKNVFIYII